MKLNYDFGEYNADEQSTVDVLAGNYNENPFIFENKLLHTMGMETTIAIRPFIYTTRIPFIASKQIKEQAKAVFF